MVTIQDPNDFVRCRRKTCVGKQPEIYRTTIRQYRKNPDKRGVTVTSSIEYWYCRHCNMRLNLSEIAPNTKVLGLRKG